jgi:3D (Asp-Asp-Asp) domain-containing protein
MIKYIVTITIYYAVAAQTDSTPLITASGYHIKGNDKIIAVSRDLLKDFPYGTKVEVCCNCYYEGIYKVEDTMNKRFTNTIDILTSPDKPYGKWKGTIKKL